MKIANEIFVTVEKYCDLCYNQVNFNYLGGGAMELGEKILLARKEAGLSQRQLCGEEITRNMLSQIEHGSAKPSMKTLQYLASRLEKPISYFLEEDSVLLPNQKAMFAAREAFQKKAWAEALEALNHWQGPNEVFDPQRQLLESLSLLALAEEAIGEGRYPYARELLERAGERTKDPAYPLKELEHRRLLLLGKLPGEDLAAVCSSLPSLDEELLLRAEAAMVSAPDRAEALLNAVEDTENMRRNLLMGKLYLAKKEYAAAAACLEKAEDGFPKEAIPMLEICHRELGDFRKAYHYACKQRG